MKINRIILIVCWLLSLAGISFYGGAVSYGFFAAFTLIPIVSAVYLIFVYSKFKIYQHLDTKTAVCNQVIPFYFILQNETFFTFSGIRVKYYSTLSTISDLDDSVEYELMPHTGITKNTGLVCKYRGIYEVGIKTVEIQDMFRLFKVRFKNRSVISVEIKPEIIYIGSLKSVDEKSLLENTSDCDKQQMDVLSRKYETGDDIRYINWKVSARERELMVRKQTGAQQHGIGIFLSTNRNKNIIEEYLPIENKMLELSIALTLYFSSNNIPVSTYYRTRQLKETRVDSVDKFEEYYNDMSAMTFSKDNNDSVFFSDALSVEQVYENKIAFFILSEWSDAALNMAEKLNLNSISVVAYIVGDEDSTFDTADMSSMTKIISVSPDTRLEEVL